MTPFLFVVVNKSVRRCLFFSTISQFYTAPKNKVYSLSSIEKLTVENGTLRIYLHNKPMLGGASAYISLENIPNYDTFLIILSQLRLL